MDGINIGLTQFIDFTFKHGPSRVNYVKKLKYQTEYHPNFDYWKELRDEIKNIHQNNLALSTLDRLIPRVRDDKRNNYATAIRQYKKFCKGKNLEWFDVGKSYWSFDELIVRSTPELGLKINGVPYLVKLYFKGKNEKVDKRNTVISLILMKESEYSINGIKEAVPSVLNVEKCRLYSLEKKVDEDMRLSLEADAENLIYLWNKI